ncbi:unnamed protein product [Peronospora belbahrii]|uniref:Uncharacterized protein n=1 Tax=Peronospora belbahrii TaxID=622444 RepID=A0ABN8CPJ0_9STRA|nr:unnamed protein product [Peronospora belbahrii]
MHFPSQVQRKRIKPTSPPESSYPVRNARDSSTPWYIVSVGDEDESQDIRVLTLERKGAMNDTEITAQDKANEANLATKDCTSEDAVRSSPSRTRSCGQNEQDVHDGRNESKCIFTPVKKARKYEVPLDAVLRIREARSERPPSSIASGVDMLFFNDGEELPLKTRGQHVKHASMDPGSSETRKRSSFSQQFNGNGTQDCLRDMHQLQLQQGGIDEDFDNKGVFNRQGCDDEQQFFDSVHDQPAFFDDTSETSSREFQRWKVDSNSYADFGPVLPFDRKDSTSFMSTSERREKVHGTPPSSPVDVSPLSFRMSRAEVLQSQLSTTAHNATHDPVKHEMTCTSVLHPSPSPSTSASSQGSIVLDRPPLGWQKKMMLSVREDETEQPEHGLGRQDSLSTETSTSSPTKVVGQNQNNRGPQRLPFKSSPSPISSTGSDSENSLLSAVVPANAKEHIMAAAASQQLSPHSRMWCQRPAKTKLGKRNSADDVFSGKSMTFQQAWVMSSRTKTILDAVSSLNDPSMENATEEPKTKYQEMESVAVYMYTLVQCYKIDESFRADRPKLPVVEHAYLRCKASSPPASITRTNQSACRREIIISPKHAD